MDGVKLPLEVNMNWNPKYSYSELPKGYTKENLPEHWKVMLQKVEPASMGIPTFRNILISDVNVINASTAIIAVGLKDSYASNFELTNVSIEANKSGKINYANNWTFTNVSIKAKNNIKLEVVNSTDMHLE
jgi:hypothetical protein